MASIQTWILAVGALWADDVATGTARAVAAVPPKGRLLKVRPPGGIAVGVSAILGFHVLSSFLGPFRGRSRDRSKYSRFWNVTMVNIHHGHLASTP